MSVVIKIKTGFVGGEHICDTGLSVEEWKALSDSEQQELIQAEIENHIEAYTVDEDTDEVV